MYYRCSAKKEIEIKIDNLYYFEDVYEREETLSVCGDFGSL